MPLGHLEVTRFCGPPAGRGDSDQLELPKLVALRYLALAET